MTTIAWDGKTLAADSQSSLFKGSVNKIHSLEDGQLFAASGNLHDGIAVKQWLNSGGTKPVVSDTFHVILITLKGELLVLEKCLYLVPYPRPFFAIGSGRDYAVAAMYLGKTAKEAVKVASVFDVDTGGVVTVRRLPLNLRATS